MARLGARSLLCSYCKPEKHHRIIMVSKKFYYHPILINYDKNRIINYAKLGDTHIETSRSKTAISVHYSYKDDCFRYLQNPDGFEQLYFTRYFEEVEAYGEIVIDTSLDGVVVHGAPEIVMRFGLNMPEGYVFNIVCTIYRDFLRLLELDEIQQYLHSDARWNHSVAQKRADDNADIENDADD